MVCVDWLGAALVRMGRGPDHNGGPPGADRPGGPDLPPPPVRGAGGPATQAEPAAHALPQAPQWASLVRVSVSQPLVALPSQFA